MRFPPDFLDEIRARIPISQLVGTRVTFDAKKSNGTRGDFWACCPFHREKTPSFHCDDGRGRYHCFGCGASGDVFRFLTELDGLSFPDAVAELASLAGLAMPKQDEAAQIQEKERASLHEVLEKATLFFEQSLKKSSARLAQDYLMQRGLSDATWRHFRLGYATDSRSDLREYLSSNGIGLDLMEQAGVLVSGDDVAVPYDRFRHRIIFPITDLKERVVGFGGRALNVNARAKYLNSPEGELFHKGGLLYNLAQARLALRADNRREESAKPLIVVEGYMDVIALTQAGHPQVVAPLGTALTAEQLQLLWRSSATPILCFDGDDAGFNAALRALDRALPLLKTGFSLQFMLLPTGKDPDDIVREGSGDAFTALLRQALPLAEMLWQREIRGRNFDTPESRALLEKSLKQAIFTITDDSLRHYYLQDIRTRLRNFFAPSRQNSSHAINGRYEHRTRQGATQGQKRWQNFKPGSLTSSASLATSRMVVVSGFSSREAAILALLTNHPGLWEENFDKLERIEFENSRLKSFYQAMLNILAQWHPNDAQAMRKLLENQGQKHILEEIDAAVMRMGLHTATPQAPFEDARTALNQALHLHMRAHTLHKQLREIEAELLENPQEHHFAMLAHVKAELEQTDAIQALVDGFGDWMAK